MVHIKQPEGSSLCGQACIAMISNVSLDRAIEVVGHKSATRTKELVSALKTLGINCDSRLRICKRNMPILPKRCIIAMRNKSYKRGHWVVMWDGVMFDPEHDAVGRSGGWKVTSYLEVYS